MDYMKRATCANYTAWDLNCPRVVYVRNRQKLEAMFKRTARRTLKKDLKKELDNCFKM